MQHGSWNVSGLALVLALALAGNLYADARREYYRDGEQGSREAVSEEAREVPDQDAVMQPIEGMMEQMQGMTTPGGMMGWRMMGRWGRAAAEDDDDEDGPFWGAMMGHGDRMGYGYRMGEGGWFMHHMERMAQQLDLTEAQQTQIQALHRTYAKAAIRARANRRIQKINLHELLDTESVKMDDVRALLDNIAAQRAELRFSHITLMQDIKKLLTPEQQKKFRSMGGFMMAQGGNMGCGRMGRPKGWMDRGGMGGGYRGMKNP